MPGAGCQVPLEVEQKDAAGAVRLPRASVCVSGGFLCPAQLWWAELSQGEARVREKQACGVIWKKRDTFWHIAVFLCLRIGDLGPSHADLCQMRCKSGPRFSEVLAPLSPKTLTLGSQLASKK